MYCDIQPNPKFFSCFIRGHFHVICNLRQTSEIALFIFQFATVLFYVNKEMLLRKMAEFDASVEQFEQTVTEKIDAMTKRHDLEIKELLRLQKSYQRLMKRKYPDYEPNTLADRRKKKLVVVEPIGQSET